MVDHKKVVITETTATVPVRIVPIYDLYTADRGQPVVLWRDAGDNIWHRRRIDHDLKVREIVSDEVRFGTHVVTLKVGGQLHEVYVPDRAYDFVKDLIETLADEGGLYPGEDE